MEYTFTHRRQTVQIYQEDDRGQSPKSILPHPKGPQRQTHITTSWQNVPMPLRAHKWSSMVDTHHNQLAKCPNDTVCSQNVLTIKYKSKHFVPKREVSRAHTRRLTRSWSFQKNLSVLPRKNVSWQSMPSRRETRRTLEINGFGSCYECSPKSPSRDQRAKSREASSKARPSHLTALSWPQSCLGMQETAISREHRGATWAPKTATGSGVQWLPALKSVKRQGWWKWMFVLSQGPAMRGGREADSCPKADFFPLTFRGQELL